jgi:hypothetical protein
MLPDAEPSWSNSKEAEGSASAALEKWFDPLAGEGACALTGAFLR